MEVTLDFNPEGKPKFQLDRGHVSFDIWTPGTNFVLHLARVKEQAHHLAEDDYPVDTMDPGGWVTFLPREQEFRFFRHRTNPVKHNALVFLDVLIDRKTMIKLPMNIRDGFLEGDAIFFIRSYISGVFLAEAGVVFATVRDHPETIYSIGYDIHHPDGTPLHFKVRVNNNSLLNIGKGSRILPTIPAGIPVLSCSGSTSIPLSYITYYSGPCFTESWLVAALQDIFALRSHHIKDVDLTDVDDLTHDILLFLVARSHTHLEREEDPTGLQLRHRGPPAGVYTNGFTNETPNGRDRSEIIVQMWNTLIGVKWENGRVGKIIDVVRENLGTLYLVGDSLVPGFHSRSVFRTLHVDISGENFIVSLEESTPDNGTLLYSDGRVFRIVDGGKITPVDSGEGVGGDCSVYSHLTRPRVPLSRVIRRDECRDPLLLKLQFNFPSLIKENNVYTYLPRAPDPSYSKNHSLFRFGGGFLEVRRNHDSEGEDDDDPPGGQDHLA